LRNPLVTRWSDDIKNKTQKCTSRYLLIHIARQKRDKLSHPSNYCFHVLFCRFTAHALKRIARTHSRLDARVCHYTHSSVWIMRDGRLIIILIVTYNIRCIGAISFSCVHDTRRYIFLDQLFSRATMRDHSGRNTSLFRVFLFSLRENRIHHLCPSKYRRDGHSQRKISSRR